MIRREWLLSALPVLHSALYRQAPGARAKGGIGVANVKEFGLSLEIASAAEITRCARLAEEAGFGSFWVLEDPFFRGAFSLAAAVACQTESLRVGISVVNPYTRHPAITAMEFGALDEISGGRGVLGIGAGVRFWMEDQLHLAWEKPGRAMREMVDIIRRLLGGEQLTYEGAVFALTDAALHFSPTRSDPPIHLGVVGPKNLQMAGAIADGVILSTLSSPEYVRFACEQVKRGAARAGRALDGFQVSAILPISLSNDAVQAREAIKPVLAILLGISVTEATSPLLSCVDFPEELLQQFRGRFAGGDLAMDLVDDNIIDTFAIAGSPETCVRRMAEFVDAGLDIPIVFEIPGVSPKETIDNVKRYFFSEFL
jgi:5,10-methylenetetrahydromethanopterin reductase